MLEVDHGARRATRSGRASEPTPEARRARRRLRSETRPESVAALNLRRGRVTIGRNDGRLTTRRGEGFSPPPMTVSEGDRGGRSGADAAELLAGATGGDIEPVPVRREPRLLPNGRGPDWSSPARIWPNASANGSRLFAAGGRSSKLPPNGSRSRPAASIPGCDPLLCTVPDPVAAIAELERVLQTRWPVCSSSSTSAPRTTRWPAGRTARRPLRFLCRRLSLQPRHAVDALRSRLEWATFTAAESPAAARRR